MSARATRAELREQAATAAYRAAIGVQGLLDIATSVMPESRDAESVVAELLAGTRLSMELAGFHPDESERGQLYRAIVDYIGEEAPQPRLLGGASDMEVPHG